jgi:aminoglycoside phosphotransferase family enzyme
VFAPTCKRLSAAIDAPSGLFDARVRDGRMVEGHGDLRPEHICLLREPKIIDCLEFSREFRILDIADELAFLALECERLGAPSFARVIFDTYARNTGDAPPQALVHFHCSLRALMRAKISLWHLDEPGFRDGRKWMALARTYLALAAAHAARTE